MPESLRDVIEDILRKLKANAYQNEEHVRLSLVARVVRSGATFEDEKGNL